MVRNVFWVVFAAALLAGCATRPETGALVSVSAKVPGTKTHEIFVATTRKVDSQPGTYFSGERSDHLNFARFAVSVPPAHKNGEVEWPSQHPGNPATDFVTTEGARINSQEAFIAAINARLAAKPKGKRTVTVFIHGYNTLFAESAYRLTQVVHDSEADFVPVLFSWASRGSAKDYVYDNNSATAARDSLEQTLHALAMSSAEDINILAHSMGNWLTVEVLRQLNISKDGQKVLSKLGLVTLASPDIDSDVFKTQMLRIGRLQTPFLIVVSKDDRALAISQRIAGGVNRLGNQANTDVLAGLGAIVVDLSDMKTSDSLNHGKFAHLSRYGRRLRAGLAVGALHPPPGERGREILDDATDKVIGLIKLPFHLVQP